LPNFAAFLIATADRPLRHNFCSLESAIVTRTPPLQGKVYDLGLGFPALRAALVQAGDPPPIPRPSAVEAPRTFLLYRGCMTRPRNVEGQSNMNTEATLIVAQLKQFTGSEQFYRHGLSRNHIYTEGVQFLAERAQAYWLLDKIALHGSSKIGCERFQVWKLTVNPNGSATLTTEDGNDNVLRTENLSYTDFPLQEIALWSVRNELNGYTIMLPSEY